jgi:ankyrin repeat protein
MLATINHHTDIARLLIAENAADLTARNSENTSALELAQSGGDTAIAELIITAYPQTFDHAISIGNLATVQRYIADPDTYHIRDRLDHALVCAAKGGYNKIVCALLQVPGITAARTDEDGCTALIYAVTRCEPETLQALLKAPQLDVNAHSNSSGWTALMFAAAFSNISAVTDLLHDKRVDLHARNHYQHTARELAHNDVKGHTILRLLDEAERARPIIQEAGHEIRQKR